MRPDDEYIVGVLQTIVKNKWKEALPLLAVGIQDTDGNLEPIFRFRRQEQAAEVWLLLTGKDLSPRQEMEFMLRIMKGEEPSVSPKTIRPLQNVINKEVARFVTKENGLQKNFREAIITALTENEYKLTSEEDFHRARLAGIVLGTYLWATEEDMQRLYGNPTPFNLVVLHEAIDRLDIRSTELDRMFLDASRSLWRADGLNAKVTYHVRYMVAINANLLPKIEGADALLLEFLKDIEASPDPYAGKQLTWAVVSCASLIQGQRPLSGELVEYLYQMARDPRYNARTIGIKPGVDVMPYVEELRNVYLTYMNARDCIDQVLRAHEAGLTKKSSW